VNGAPFCLLALIAVSPSFAQSLRISRVLPPPGIEIPAEKKEALATKLAEIERQLAQTPLVAGYPNPDIEVLTKAVALALEFGEFYAPKDVDKAERLLQLAQERLKQASAAPWTEARGLVVRGYRSRVDGSAQPYGLVIPDELPLGPSAPRVPLYIFLHGRGDKQTDLHFIDERLRSKGQIAPAGAIVLHPFGRQCVGYKSAGETDVLEAVQHVREHYPIDSDKIVLMGFSMGGAGAWHLGAHYAHQWRVVAPGAGFAETAQYTKTDPASVPAYERLLWGCYDCPAYVRNLFNTRTIAYSGELDKQIQAARVMEQAFATEGKELDHRIGPGVEHKYEPQTLAKLMQDIQEELPWPRLSNDRHWQSRTLRYASARSFTVFGLEAHWEDARVEIASPRTMRTKNVRAVRWNIGGGEVVIDGKTVAVPAGEPTPTTFVKTADRWEQGVFPPTTGLWKVPRLQGPIDDAFLDPFLVVLPTGVSPHPKFQAWQTAEREHFLTRWRGLMRGSARVKNDVDVTAEDAQQYHMILWGDPESNSVLKRLADKLPVQYSAAEFSCAGRNYARDGFAPAFLFPHPDHPRSRYVVLNSGLTFREAHDKTNSQQNPKLPDWAVIDLSQPPDERAPGKIAAAGFFDEQWRVIGK
jgi:predicted esterase